MKKPLKTEANLIEDLSIKTINALLLNQKIKLQNLYKKAEKLYQLRSYLFHNILSYQFLIPITHLLEMNYCWRQEFLRFFSYPSKEEHSAYSITSN